MPKLLTFVLAASVLAGVAGCDNADDSLSQPAASQPAAQQPAAPAATNPPAPPANAPPKEPPRMAKIVGSKPKYDDPPPSRPRLTSVRESRSNFHDAAWGADAVMKEVADAAAARPAMAVWVIDEAAGGSTRGEVMQEVVKSYGRLPKEVATNLVTAVVAAGDDVRVLTPEPIADSAPLQLALADAGAAHGPTKLFTAVEQAAEKFLPLAAKQKRDVVLTVVSSEGGGDRDKLDDAVAALRKYNSGLSYFTITTPTSFSKKAGKGPSEGFYPEQIDMSYADLQGDNDVLNSGFGPFGICRLAKEVRGGRVLLLDGGGLDASVMKKYAPEYVSEKQYEELISQNKARKALYEAAAIKQHAEILGMRGQSRFVKTDEAGFQRQLSQSQRASALLEQNISRLYDVLATGESDRKNLTSPRLQAEYDLAFGRVLAAKARNDGYNAMLAVIKQGKAFKSPKSGSWLLDESDDLSEAGSVLAGMAKKSRKYLQAVVKDHPGTPWATIAARELTHQSGWKWSED